MTTTPTATPAVTDPGELFVSTGLVSREQLDYALRVRSKLEVKRPIASILQELEFITEEKLLDTLRANRLDLPIGALLVELGALREQDLQAAVGLQQETPGKKLGEVLVENHFLSEDDLLDVLSVHLGFPYLDVDSLPVDRRLIAPLQPGWLERNRCFPFRDESGVVRLAMCDPQDDSALAEASRALREELQPVLVQQHILRQAIRTAGRPVEVDRSEQGVVRIVNEILRDAIDRNASDIHIEPMKRTVRVRVRQDGVLIRSQELANDLRAALTSRLKVMAGADIAEKRRHQDGRMLFEHRGAKIDLRVSFYTTIHGEKIVLRLLNNRSNLLDIHELGMAPRVLERFRYDVLDVPSGVVLVTGPTGSGKTTTLYGAINYLNNISTSIITAEDPVEYVIDGINQCSINTKIGITYEETLRHIVRQDPDVIVIGEVRDRFSADTAIQAALTGHKVLTTFHTEDSIGGLLRLLHMDIEAFLISSTVVSVLAQRLVRRVCPNCREDHVLSADEKRRLGYAPAGTGEIVFARGRGCPQCRHLGYRGRTAIYELLILNEQVKEALIQRRTSYEIRRISTESTGLVSLLEDGILKAIDGKTSYEEIIRSLPRLAAPRPLSELARLQGVRT